METRQRKRAAVKADNVNSPEDLNQSAAMKEQQMPILVRERKRRDDEAPRASPQKRRRMDSDSEHDDSIYATPATHASASTYTTPATHLVDPAIPPSSNTPSREPSSRAKLAMRSKASDATPKRIRFSSEDPPVATEPAPVESVNGALNGAADTTPDSEDDYDEAPEAITHTAAIESTRAAETGAAKAAAAQKAAAKAKRRQRDATLKSQAAEADKDSQRRKKRRKVDDDEHESESESTDVLRRGKLPPLLPQELLDSVPAIRPPSPVAELSVMSKPNNKLNLLEVKKPKDVMRGPVKVRVLGDANPRLPPKAEGKAKSDRQVKEHWIAGRQRTSGKLKGAVGSGKMERRSLAQSGGRGFLRS